VSRYLPLAFVVFALCVAAGAAAAFVPAKTYRTSATIVIDINNDPTQAGASVQQATFLLPAIEQRAMSRSMRERAAIDVPELFRRTRVDIEAASDASVLRIRGTSESAEAAQVWVNAVADRLVEEQSPDSPVVLGVLDGARLKPKPIAPNVEPIMAAFIVFGLIAALFSTLAADRIRRAFDTNQTVRERLGTTVLGELPALRRRTEARVPIVTLLDDASASPTLVSAFEAIRTNVEFRMAQAQASTVTFLSVGRDANNAKVTAGLAYSMAAVGRNVAVVEADLREPRIATELDVVPGLGLGDVATFGLESLQLQPTSHPRLALVPAGLPTRRPGDVVATGLPTVLDAIRSEDRAVFVDGPPLGVAPEAAIVVANVKHVVVTIPAGSSALSDLEDAIELIEEAGGVLLGVIVNGVARRKIRGTIETTLDVVGPPPHDDAEADDADEVRDGEDTGELESTDFEADDDADGVVPATARAAGERSDDDEIGTGER
ncbi:MAG: hypothetical protein AAFP84_03700, partial [Actinomycetota bacterium]